MLSAGQMIRGSIFNEPMRVITVEPVGADAWRFGLAGVQSERFRQVTLTRADIAALAVLSGTILLTPNERRVAEDHRGCYWLYAVTDSVGTKLIPKLRGGQSLDVQVTFTLQISSSNAANLRSEVLLILEELGLAGTMVMREE